MGDIQKQTISKARPLFDYLKKHQEDQRFIRSIEIAATFILISFFMFFAIRPTALTISTLIGDIKSKEIQSQAMKSKINNIISAQDAFSQIQEKYQIVESALPETPRYSHIALQIKKTAAASQISLNKLIFDLKSDNSNSYSISFTEQVPFTSAAPLVDSFLRNRRLMNIDSFSISTIKEDLRQPSATSSGKVNLGFASNIFYWKIQNEKK